MRTLECIIFNVEHGFCSFIKSPNNYGLLIDCGCRDLFSPIKWIRKNYNIGKGNISYYEKKRIAKGIISHLHLDHFEDIGSFKLNSEDKPKRLLRDKENIKMIEEKIIEESDDSRKKILLDFKEFSESYTENVTTEVNWGFDFFSNRQISIKDAKEISENENQFLNNRSFITSVSFAGNKILLPGDMEVKGWHKAFCYKEIREILKGTNFYIASHHGHKSGFTSEILKHTGIPELYIVSAKSGDLHIDTSYSNSNLSKGYLLKGDNKKSKMVSTRERDGSIKITIYEDGTTSVEIIEAKNNLNLDQKKQIKRNTKRYFDKCS